MEQVNSVEFRQAQINLKNAQNGRGQAPYEAKIAELEVMRICGKIWKRSIKGGGIFEDKIVFENSRTFVGLPFLVQNLKLNFLSVAAQYFFERLELLKRKHPELY